MPLVHHRNHVSRNALHHFNAAGALLRREPSSSDSYAQNIVSTASHTTRTVSIVAGVLSALVVMGVVVWQVRLWRSRKSSQRTPALESKLSAEKNSYTVFGQKHKIDFSAAVSVEKPKATYEGPKPMILLDSNGGWVPQISSYRGQQMTNKQLAAIKSSPKKYAKWEKSLMLSHSNRSPPPYSAAKAATSQSSSETAKSQTLLPPGISSSSSSPTPTSPPEPLPSPARTMSFANQQDTKRPKSHSVADKQKPRLMKVVNTFTPKLEDELSVTIGETVRLVEEFQDGWCFIQRKDGNQGVVPRFCLVHRPHSHSR